MNYKIPAWCAIISAILIIPSFVIGVLSAALMGNTTVRISLIAILVMGMVLLIIKALGYLQLANTLHVPLLKNMVYLLIIFGVINATYNIITNITIINPLYGIIFLVLNGALFIVFGVAVMKLKESFKISKSLGVMYIVTGAIIVSIILALLMPLLSIAIAILEAILFFSAAKGQQDQVVPVPVNPSPQAPPTAP